MAPTIPSYFTRTPPADWALTAYLEGEYTKRAKSYDHNRVVAAWISSLRHFEKDPDDQISGRANSLLAKYFTERPSDRMAAKRWNDSRKRTAAQSGRRQRQRQRESQNGVGGPPSLSFDFKPSISFAPPNISVSPSLSATQLNGVVAAAAGPAGPATRARQTVPPPKTPSADTPTVVSEKEVAGVPDLAPPVPDVPPPPAESSKDAVHESEVVTDLDDEPATRIEEVCASLHQVYTRMHGKLALSASSSVSSLEDALYNHVFSLPELTHTHFFIVDASTLRSLITDASGLSTMLSRVQRLPAFPERLETHLSRYSTVKTARDCRVISRAAADDDEDNDDEDEDEDMHWLDSAILHTVRLLAGTSDLLLHNPLHEGVWDCLVYAPFWDQYFASIPDLVLQRKEIPLLSIESEPYAFLTYEPRYDGVLQSRTGGPAVGAEVQDRRYELAVFETSSRFDGTASAKWRKDRSKVLAGCRAMLCRLVDLSCRRGQIKSEVGDPDPDPAVLRELQVVGVLQAGRYNQIFVMSCLSRNVFYLREGEVREFPVRIEELAGAFDILSTVWKARRVVTDTAAALKRLFAKVDGERAARTDEEFL